VEDIVVGDRPGTHNNIKMATRDFVAFRIILMEACCGSTPPAQLVVQGGAVAEALVVVFARRRPGIGPGHLGFVVDEVALGQHISRWSPQDGDRDDSCFCSGRGRERARCVVLRPS
jgi:hypothetical protein